MVRAKIHVTGGKGFLGQKICDGLGDKYDISVSDVETVNVLQMDSLIEMLRRTKPEVVIHLAGLMGAQTSKKKLYDYFTVNSFGLLNVMEAAHRCNIKNVLFLSSLTVHGSDGEEERGKKESDLLNPQHPYATSKVIAEHIVREYSKYYGIRAVILRPTIIAGNTGGENNALNEFVRSALNKQPIVIYGSGEHKREWLSFSDLVGAVDKSIDFLLNNRGVGCEDFIISSGRPISMKELAQRCVHLLDGGQIKFVDQNTQSFSLTSLPQKAKSLLQWEAKDKIDDIICQFARDLKYDE